MLNFFNTSIFNKSLPEGHQCIDHNCSGDKLFGLNRTCKLCWKSFFFEFMAKKPEIRLIMKLLTPADFNTQSQQQIGEVSNNLNILFSNENVFQFICPSCSLNDIVNDSNRDDVINEYKKHSSKPCRFA